MEHHARRGRRGRNHSRQQPRNPGIPFGAQNFSPCQSRPWSFLSGLYSLFTMAALMAIIYLMLEYHCSTCTAKCDINSITRNVDDISKNLSQIKQSYHELDVQISRFSQELPKIEGQIEILEALANTMESKDFGWNPRNHLTLPNVDVYLNKPDEHGKNVSHLVSKHLAEMVAVAAEE